MPEKKQTTKKATKPRLPKWDLSDLYTSFDDPAFARAPKKAKALMKELETYKGKAEKGKLRARDIAKTLPVFEELEVLLLHTYAFCQLQYDVDTKNARARKEMQNAKKFLTECETRLEWYSQALKRLSPRALKGVYKHKKLQPYTHFFELLKQSERYTLSEREERVMSIKDANGADSWGHFHTEVASHLSFGELDIDGKKQPMNQALLGYHMASPDRETRKKAYIRAKEPFRDMMHVFSYMYSSVVADFEQECRTLRGYKSGLEQACIGEEVTTGDVQRMVDAVERHVDLYQEYFSWKKKTLGLRTMEGWDMTAPVSKTHKDIPFKDGKKMVLDCYKNFDQEVHDLAKAFFDKKWIDAREGGNKYAGAYSWSMFEHPYILLNYQPAIQQVFTMIHELGHGVHALLTDQHNPFLMRNHSKVVAESASQFSELLLLDHILETSQDDDFKRGLLAHHIEDLLYCISSTATVTAFEIETHERLATESMDREELCDLWMEKLDAMRGKDIKSCELDRYTWARIPHIFQTPFYYFTYPMSLFVVLSLYELYTEDRTGFVAKYKAYLSEGTTMTPGELLKKHFDLDFGTKAFYERGMKVVERLFTQLRDLS